VRTCSTSLLLMMSVMVLPRFREAAVRARPTQSCSFVPNRKSAIENRK
jgi:hypothetical protein